MRLLLILIFCGSLLCVVSQTKLDQAFSAKRCDSLLQLINYLGYSEVEIDFDDRRINFLINCSLKNKDKIEMEVGYMSYSDGQLIFDFPYDSTAFLDTASINAKFHIVCDELFGLMNVMIEHEIVSIKTDQYGDCTGHADYLRFKTGRLYYVLHPSSHCYEDEVSIIHNVKWMKELIPDVYFVKTNKKRSQYYDKYY